MGAGKAVIGLLWKYLGTLSDFSNEFDTAYGLHYEHGNLYIVMHNSPITIDNKVLLLQDDTDKTRLTSATWTCIVGDRVL